MGDRAPLTVTIYKAAPEHFEVVGDVLATYGLGQGYWGDPNDVDPREDLRLGEPWIEPETRLGTAEEIATMLVALGVPVWFSTQEDAYSPYLGELFLYTPDLGLWKGSCTDEGTPVFTDNEVRDIVSMRLTDQDPGGSIMETRLGKPWFDELGKLST